ncbi:(Fe-S)-binding protein [Insolitispirillum peregrinum]|uniref:L-lactate dehydrogenase complex protein LldE n=1 Tax=Insolitispirillum peregrinum TaxID=80876 RepID=A0A1N7JEN2_9PROT|nr:(Fe-S)-binding protein [Insolitispirillum peregrinum]SIS47721.1 L-lactate dehydrogenase complex protein LldE [Insolitispirillum peregrinum]
MDQSEISAPRPPVRVALFITCLADMFRPAVGFATVALLEQAGCEVVVPQGQTCCGQPQWNSGDRRGAQKLARAMITAFEQAEVDYVVAPSGSCIGMVKDWPQVFSDDAAWQQRATAIAEKSWELTSFLVDRLGWTQVQAHLEGIAAYHDSCTGKRKLGVAAQPRALLAGVAGLEVRDLSAPEECCGFGGTFCVKYGDISSRMVTDKAKDIIATGADTLLAGDVGCLLNMQGRLRRLGSPIKVRHVAEVLANMGDQPAIGEGE